jgi:hypothetical protein
MHPEQLIPLLTSLSAAADVMEALDNPDLQTDRGWDLACWHYESVPWGVRFLHHDAGGRVDAEVRAIGVSPGPTSRTVSHWPTTLLSLH